MDIQQFWKVTLQQDAVGMKEFFASDAWIRWHNTNEHFTVDEFIQANCEYPNQWDWKIERMEKIDDFVITVVHVFSIDQPLSFHVTSFIKVKDNKIASIDEYWGEDGIAPQWRLDKRIGKAIS